MKAEVTKEQVRSSIDKLNVQKIVLVFLRPFVVCSFVRASLFIIMYVCIVKYHQVVCIARQREGSVV